MPTPERVIETIRAECLDPTLIQRSAASRSDAPDLCRARQPRATPSRPRPRPSTSRSVGPDAGQSARRSPTGSARWADPRVSRRRRVIESGFPIPTRRAKAIPTSSRSSTPCGRLTTTTGSRSKSCRIRPPTRRPSRRSHFSARSSRSRLSEPGSSSTADRHRTSPDAERQALRRSAPELAMLASSR